MKQICEENGYFFTDNSNIEIRDLRKDGIHVSESGKTKIADNFIYFLNNSHWLSQMKWTIRITLKIILKNLKIKKLD